MIIRKFKVSDAVEVSRIHRGTIKNVNIKDYSPKQIREWARKSTAKRFKDSMKNVFRFVAVDNKKIVGFGDFTKKGKLTGLYIHKAHQNKNIGSKILKKLEKEALKKGIKKYTVSSTITAKKFYEKNGYITIKKIKHRIGNQKLTCFRMEKSLLKK